jgi:hypothetical protein
VTLRGPRHGWLGLCALVLAGCSMAPQSRSAQLREAVMGYNDALRWGRVERAAAYLPVAERAAFVAKQRAALLGLRVHDVEVRDVSVGEQHDSARVLVSVTYSRAGQPVLQQINVLQRWRWSGGGWTLVERREIKPPQPGREASPGDLL